MSTQAETVEFASDPQVITGPDGVRYELVITGTADVVRGPLGRFIDLADQITSEGLDVPAGIAAVLEELRRSE